MHEAATAVAPARDAVHPNAPFQAQSPARHVCNGPDRSGSGASVLHPTYDFDGVWENLAAGLEERASYHARLRYLIFAHRTGGRVNHMRLEQRDP
jgi:hypothetical protein